MSFKYIDHGIVCTGRLPNGKWEIFDSVKSYEQAYDEAMKEWLKEA